MMLLLAALLAAAIAPPATVLPLGELPPQVMAKNSCALFLWDRATKHRVVMMIAIPEPATIRVVRNGKTVTLAQIAAEGEPVLGFYPKSSFGDGNLKLDFDLAITRNDGVAGGGIIRDGVLTVTTSDGAAVVAPVAGLVGCG